MKLKMFKKQLLILVFLLLLQNSSAFLQTLAAILNGATLVIEFIKTLPSAVQSVQELISIFTGGSSNFVTANPGAVVSVTPNPVILDTTRVKDLGPRMEQYHEEFVEKFEEMDTKLNNLRLFTAEQFRQIQQFINDLPQEIDTVLRKETVTQFIENIHTEWNRVMGFVKLGVNEKIYSHLMKTNLDYIEKNLVNFRVAITPSASLFSMDSGLLTEIATMQKDRAHTLCNGETSHDSIMHIFRIIISTEVKTFILRALALNNEFPEDNTWEAALNLSEIELKQQMTRYLTELKKVLAIEKMPYITACKAKGTNFYHVLSQKWLHYFTKVETQNCIPIDTKLGCDYLDDCEAVKSSFDDGSTSCSPFMLLNKVGIRDISKFIDSYLTAQPGSDNNYKIVDYAGSNWKSPERPVAATDDLDEAKMKFCKCSCYTYKKFVLALMQSRVNDNYVVVAVRFQKTGNYIYIQIAEGKLEGNAYISNFSWIQPTKKKTVKILLTRC